MSNISKDLQGINLEKIDLFYENYQDDYAFSKPYNYDDKN